MLDLFDNRQWKKQAARGVTGVPHEKGEPFS